MGSNSWEGEDGRSASPLAWGWHGARVWRHLAVGSNEACERAHTGECRGWYRREWERIDFGDASNGALVGGYLPAEGGGGPVARRRGRGMPRMSWLELEIVMCRAQGGGGG